MRHLLLPMLSSLRNRHFIIFDVSVVAITPFIALLVRVEQFESVEQYSNVLLVYSLFCLFWKPIFFWFAGLYRRYWPYASVDALVTLMVATGLSTLIETAGSLIVSQVTDRAMLPRSVPFLTGVFTMILVAGSRFFVRTATELGHCHQKSGEAKPILIVGAGVAGSMVAKELHNNPQVELQPVGFLDDDPAKLGLRIHELPVLGPLDELPSIAERFDVKDVVIAMPTAPGKIIRSVHKMCKEVGISSKTIPGIFEILQGSAEVSQIRDIDIEDLLRRGPVQTDTEAAASLIARSSVMVTGAGGSIGAELCRQIMRLHPRDLVLLGHGENSIFGIAGELRRNLQCASGVTRVHEVVADIRDRRRMVQVVRRYKPGIVFHAAAHKHVGLMEANLQDAISNNVLGTRILVELANDYGVERFVMISSDKAVNPTSVMGVTKRIAELVVQDVAIRYRKAFVSVRFGNVLGSRGSVVPIFKAQVAAGGPVFVTDPEATRFFMTIPEAVQLVLQAATIGRGGEVFVLDMGEPIRIIDLARDVIRLSGLKEGSDIDIQFTGLKQGEKLHEELFYASEVPVRSTHGKIYVCQSPMYHALSHLLTNTGVLGDMREVMTLDSATEMAEIDFLLKMAPGWSPEEIERCIERIVPQYRPRVIERLTESKTRDQAGQIGLESTTASEEPKVLQNKGVVGTSELRIGSAAHYE